MVVREHGAHETEQVRGGQVHSRQYAFYRGASPSVFDIYRYDTGIWGFIDFFRVVLVNGMRKWYASY